MRWKLSFSLQQAFNKPEFWPVGGQQFNYMDEDAKSVLIKYQRHVTRQRVGVLELLMNHKRAFTLGQVTDALINDSIDRATIYRALKSFLVYKIVGRAVNGDGSACFFYLGHLKEHTHTQVYLECIDCKELYGLPSFPDDYLNALSAYRVTPIPTLLRGYCKNHTRQN